MTKDEFIKKAKSLDYDDEQIKDMLDLREQEKREIGYEMPYEDIVLLQQPVY